MCDIKANANFLGFTHVDFDKLGSVEKNNIEEAIYYMMVTFKTTPLEIANSLPKRLYERVEKKWQLSLQTERQIRETTLAQGILELDK